MEFGAGQNLSGKLQSDMGGDAGGAAGDPRRLSRESITEIQTEKLTRLVRECASSNPFYQAKFAEAGLDPERIESQIGSPEALRRLPLTTKADLVEDQRLNPPYGTNLTYPIDRYVRLHQTSGTTGEPLRWLDTADSWDWLMRCWQVIYDAAGVEASDRFFFPFSFGPFLGFWAGFEAAIRRGNLTLPGGAMATEARLRFMIANEATFVACTPTYALHMAEVAAEQGIDLAASAVRGIVVAGEPGGNIPETRARIETAWGARVFDHSGLTEVGALGFEAVEAPGGLHLIETECIAEIIDPKTAEPVARGERGELVLTNLGRLGSPLIRYRTGDLVQIDTEPSPSPWPFIRLQGGILGRVDSMVIIRGNNVYPSALEAVIRRFDEIGEYRAEVMTRSGLAMLTLTVEARGDLGSNRASSKSGGREDLARRVAESVRESLNFRPEVVIVDRGTLPRFELKASRFIVHPSYSDID